MPTRIYLVGNQFIRTTTSPGEVAEALKSSSRADVLRLPGVSGADLYVVPDHIAAFHEVES